MRNGEQHGYLALEPRCPKTRGEKQVFLALEEFSPWFKANIHNMSSLGKQNEFKQSRFNRQSAQMCFDKVYMHTDGTAKLTYRENFILDSDHVNHYFDSICSYDDNDIRERYSKVEKKTMALL